MSELLFCDLKGRIFSYPPLEAAGMKAGRFYPLTRQELIPLPKSSELFRMPDRFPVGFDPRTKKPVTLYHHPYSSKPEPCLAVGAFVSAGRTVTHHVAYSQSGKAAPLPLFAYAACSMIGKEFYTAAVVVDEQTRHDSAAFNLSEVKKGIQKIQNLTPRNRLVAHLARCAQQDGCANAKNFFLSRFEAPLPVSPSCNSQCLGCVSFQMTERFSCSQQRISFVPSAEELSEIATYHLEHAPKPIVSFGQGCEGEPSLYPEAIEGAIRRIRQKTGRGLIHMNTNGSFPRIMKRFFAAGLQSIRVSLNSFNKTVYQAYYRPKGYCFEDVLETIRLAHRSGIFVSLNYLTMPGFTDSRQEVEALFDFLSEQPLNMIQWRNLNYDPLLYFQDMRIRTQGLELMGIRQLIERTHRDFPSVRCGYFNPFISR